VTIDYHIAFEGNFYSVPYTLVQERVAVAFFSTDGGEINLLALY
jgi:Mu transposase-like protein